MTSADPGRRPLLWLLGAVLLCAFAASSWLPRSGDDLRLPSSPVERTDGGRAREWLFLESCRPHVPPEASVSVVAGDGATEMAVYMMAIGLFPENALVPHSYYLRATPEEFRRAQWILVYRADGPGIENAELVARVPDGAVYRRRTGA